jgi:hypothetical protein
MALSLSAFDTIVEPICLRQGQFEYSNQLLSIVNLEEQAASGHIDHGLV